MLDSVVDEVGSRLEQKIAVTLDGHVLISDDREMRPLVFRGGIEQLRDLSRHRSQIYDAECCLSVRRLDLRYPHK